MDAKDVAPSGAASTDVLDPDLRGRALRAVDDIVRAIELTVDEGWDGPRYGRLDSSLARGLPGLAVFFAHMDLAFPGHGHAERAEDLFDRAARALKEERVPPGLMVGFAGIAWTAAHLAGIQGREAGRATEQIDELLTKVTARAGWRAEYDLVSGLVGIGVYALERSASDVGRELFANVIERLDESKERTTAGVAWFTRPDLIPPEARPNVPYGYYNLGAAHGVPGIIALLSAGVRREIAPQGSEELLRDAVGWVLAEQQEGGESRWPFYVGRDVDARTPRLAWCYGDAGVSASLWNAGVALNDGELARAAADLMISSLGRETSAGITDVSVCHGSSGLALIYERFRRWTHDEAYGEGVRRWTRFTLDRRGNDGFAGFSVWDPDSDVDAGDVQGPGMLAGAAGAALVLTTLALGLEPSWDRMLLLSIDD